MYGGREKNSIMSRVTVKKVTSFMEALNHYYWGGDKMTEYICPIFQDLHGEFAEGWFV